MTVAPTPLHRESHRRARVWIAGAFVLVAIGVAIGLVINWAIGTGAILYSGNPAEVTTSITGSGTIIRA